MSDLDKEKAPAGEAGAEQSGQPEKAESWFPVARKDIAKIRRNYPATQAARLLYLFCELISCVNYWGRNPFKIDLDQLGAKVGVCRQTAKSWLLDLQRIKLIKLAESKRGKGGRFEISSITVKSSVPCRLSQKVNVVDRVKKPEQAKLTVHNNTPTLRVVGVEVREKESLPASGAASGCADAPLPPERDDSGWGKNIEDAYNV